MNSKKAQSMNNHSQMTTSKEGRICCFSMYMYLF